MPSWKKVTTSGSSAEFSHVTASAGIAVDNLNPNITLASMPHGGTAAIRLVEGSNFRGGVIKFDGSSNILKIGTHEASDSDASNDIDAITIARSTGIVTIPTSLVSDGNVTAAGYIAGDGGFGSQRANILNNFNSYIGLVLKRTGTGTGDFLRLTDSSENIKLSVDSLGSVSAANHITASGNIKATKFIGDGSELTGVSSVGGIFVATGSFFNTTNDLQVTGSLDVTGSILVRPGNSDLTDNDALGLYVKGLNGGIKIGRHSGNDGAYTHLYTDAASTDFLYVKNNGADSGGIATDRIGTSTQNPVNNYIHFDGFDKDFYGYHEDASTPYETHDASGISIMLEADHTFKVSGSLIQFTPTEKVTVTGDLDVSGNITGSGNISGSATSTGSFGTLRVGPTSGYGAASGIAFGDGDTAIYEQSNDVLNVKIGAQTKWQFSGDNILSPGSNKAQISPDNGVTSPNFIPARNHTDTGYGSNGGKMLSLIAGGASILQVSSSGTISGSAT